MSDKNQSNQVHAELSRDLNLFHVTMMGLGMMIGAGVFFGIGECTKTSGGGGLLLTFGLNGLIALFSAMSFAELASAIPRAGGAYNFARISYGRPAGFQAGWFEWLASSSAGAFYGLMLSTYVLKAVSLLGWDGWLIALGVGPAENGDPNMIAVRAFALMMAGMFIYINYRGSSETGKIGAIFTVLQMLFVVGIGIAGTIAFIFEPERIENYKPFFGNGNWGTLLGSMGIIYVAFEGFEVIAQAGDETIEPRKNIPKAILYSVFFVTITYLLVGFGTLVAVKVSQTGNVAVWEWIAHKEQFGFQAAVDKLFTGWGAWFVTLAVIFSATSALNATIYSATRTSFALGRDGMLPRSFSKIAQKTKTPYIALMGTSVIVFLLIGLIPDLKAASATASIMFLLLFLLVNVCVIRVRYNMGDELKYGYIMPWFPLIPILGILLQVAMMYGIFGESPVAVYIAIGWFAVSLAVYFGYSRKRALTTDEEIKVLLEQRHENKPVSKDQSHIMVAVANPDNALGLVQATCKICQTQNQPHIELIHMVPVPEQVALSDADQYMHSGKEAIMESMLYYATQYPTSSTIRYCRNVARGIYSAVRQKKANMLIMGWHGKHRGHHFTIGATVDPILERTPCDVVMVKDCGGNKKFHNVLVPIAGGPNSALALEMATSLAEKNGGSVTAMTVETPGRKPLDLKEFIEENASRCHIDQSRINCKTATGSDVVTTILETAEDYDLVVIGSTTESMLSKIAHAPIPETVAKKLEKPLVMCRAASGIQGWLNRYI